MQKKNLLIELTIGAIAVVSIGLIYMSIVRTKNENYQITKRLGSGNAPEYLVGNWYYNYGDRCLYSASGRNQPQDVVDWLQTPGSSAGTFNCTNTANVMSAFNNAGGNYQENSVFYLGTGFYESEWACGNGATAGNPGAPGAGTWKQIAQDSSNWTTLSGTQPHNIINFGGWGCCPGDPGCNATKTSNSWCNSSAGGSTGPNCVWTVEAVNDLPSGAEIAKNWNGVSLDIEGVDVSVQQNGTDFANALNQKFADYASNGLFIILTLPGFGVKTYNSSGPIDGDESAMNWFNSVKQNIDFVCLMFYSKINDSTSNMNLPGESPIPVGGVSPLVNSLDKYWSGESSKYNMPPEQIILGVSFGEGDDISGYITSDVLQRAKGGFTTWAYTGGIFNWQESIKWDSTTNTCVVGGGGTPCSEMTCANGAGLCLTGPGNKCPNGDDPIGWCDNGYACCASSSCS